MNNFFKEIDNVDGEKLETFLQLFLEWNNKLNLSGTKNVDEIIDEHFIDSLSLINFIEGGNVIDVGSGGGFPGIVLAIAKPEVNFTLVESITKKTLFLKEAKDKLNLKNLTIINERAELLPNNLKESFDYGLARAVGKINKILEYIIPYLKKDGVFIMQKGISFQGELDEAANALKVLKSEMVSINKTYLPKSGKERIIILIKKIDHTDKAFPRSSVAILKKPL